jgi:hypothetical protein
LSFDVAKASLCDHYHTSRPPSVGRSKGLALVYHLAFERSRIALKNGYETIIKGKCNPLTLPGKKMFECGTRVKRGYGKAGNLGVFDPGINPLSILTKILPEELVVRSATLTFPCNQQTPIAATMDLRTVETNPPCHVELDLRQTGKQTWEIRVDTNQARGVFCCAKAERIFLSTAS